MFTALGGLRVRDRASNHIINYVTQVEDISNLKENLNCIIGSKVKAFLLEGRLLPIGGVTSGHRS